MILKFTELKKLLTFVVLLTLSVSTIKDVLWFCGALFENRHVKNI